ncbi:MAG: hypothetical protein HON99_04200 [Crocinitomicaceae bacterium]|nr:hypothetical protein [Crocinitomicaceae bacterium]
MRTILHIMLIMASLILSYPTSMLAQDDPVMVLTSGKKGIADKFGRKIAGATISIKQDGKAFKTINTGSNGKYENIIMPYDHIYEVTISKEGFVSKITLIDGKKGYFPDEIMEKKTEIQFVPEMVSKQSGVDYSVITKSPVAKARIDPSTGQMNYDMGFISRRSKEIQKFMASQSDKQEENEKKFNTELAAGNKAFSSGNYQQAIAKYNAAKAIKPDHPGLDSKIADAENKQLENGENAEVLAQFNAKIKEGDALVSSNKFDEAIAKYEAAKSIKPGDSIPNQKIAAANKAKNNAANAANNLAYVAKMKEAKTAFDGKDYTNAKSKYEEALKLKPGERAPSDKIKEIARIFEKQAKYDALIKEADTKFAAKEWAGAKAKYQTAKGLLNESYPAEQIAKANVELAKQSEEKQKRTKYDGLIARGNAHFSSKKLELAKSSYQEALGLYDEQLPKDQLAKIEVLLKKQNEENKKKAEFDNLMAQGQKHFVNNDWVQAKTAYEAAQKITNDANVNQKITLVNKKIKEETDAAAAAELKKQKEEQYQQLLAKAKAEFDSKNWVEAKKKYAQALTIFSRKEVTDQIALINTNIQKSKAAEKTAELEKVKETNYSKAIADAKSYMTAKNWNEARKAFSSALKIYDRKEAHDGITAVQKAIKNESDAAANEAAEKAKRAQYDQLISKGNAQFQSKNWEGAKASYNRAISLFSEQLPKDQIAKINVEIEKEKENNLASAAEAKTLAQYKAKIKQADASRGLANDGPAINKAIALYKAANAIKNDETYPAEEVAKLQEKLESINSAQSAYDKLISVANTKFTNGDYDKAQELYTRAKGMHPEDPYPPKRLAEIIKKKEEQKAKELLAAKEKERRNKYENLIKAGDTQMASKNWAEARVAYTNAIKLFPEEYPKKQLVLIVKAIQDEKNATNAELAKKEKRAKYDELIVKSDNSYRQKNWGQAKSTYRAALNLFDEDYPKNQIELIDKAIQAEKDLALENEANRKILLAYNAKIKEANAVRDAATDGKKIQLAINLFKAANKIKSDETYPATEVAKLQEKLDKMNDGAAAYQKLIDVADKKLQAEDYKKAKELYARAKGLRANDKYPPAQIRKINAILKEKEAQLALDNKYNSLIAKSDTEFKDEQFKIALRSYQSALKIKPTEDYPKSQIAKIKKFLASKGELVEQKKAPKNKVDRDPDSQFGKDVTGQKSPDLAIKDLLDNQLVDDNWRDKALENTVVSEFDFNQRLESNAKSKSDDSFQKYDDYNLGLANADLKNDESRKRIIDEVENARSIRENQNVAKEKVFTDRTYTSYSKAREYIERTDREKQSAISSKDLNAEAYEQYKDQLINWKDPKLSVALARSEIAYSDNQDLKLRTVQDNEINIERREETANNQLNNKISIDEWNRALQETDNETDYRQHEFFNSFTEQSSKEADEDDQRRLEFAKRMEEYKDLDRELNAKQAENNEARTYQTHQSIENDLKKLQDISESREQPRLKYVDAYESYKDDLSKWNKNISADGDNKTYSKHNYIENYKTNAADNVDELDLQRQKKVAEYIKTIDLLEGSGNEEELSAQDKTYEVHKEQEKYLEQTQEFNVGSDKQRQRNVEANESTRDQLENQHTDKQKNATEKNYQQQQNQDEFTTKMNNQLAGADVPRQKGVDELTNVQDKMFNAQAEKNQVLEDQYNLRRNKYEDNASIDVKENANSFKNQLALDYDQGVTENVYQSTDARGNVTKVTVVRIVVQGNKGYKYIMVKTKFAEQYFKDDRPISETTWDTETTVSSE